MVNAVAIMGISRDVGGFGWAIGLDSEWVLLVLKFNNVPAIAMTLKPAKIHM